MLDAPCEAWGKLRKRKLNSNSRIAHGTLLIGAGGKPLNHESPLIGMRALKGAFHIKLL